MAEDVAVPKGLLILLVVGTIAGAAITVVGTAKAGLPTVVPVVAVIPVIALNAFVVAHALRRGRHPDEPRYTGQAMSPGSNYGLVASSENRWVGAGKLRGRLGLVHASWPLVGLSLNGSSLEMRLRLRLLGAFFGARPLRIEAGSGGTSSRLAGDSVATGWASAIAMAATATSHART
jgi:hypothetical protein